MYEIMLHFPDLKETDASAIAFEFEKWWETACEKFTADERETVMVGFAAGWIKRPTSDFSY
jgi:hypothetical protein